MEGEGGGAGGGAAGLVSTLLEVLMALPGVQSAGRSISLFLGFLSRTTLKGKSTQDAGLKGEDGDSAGRGAPVMCWCFASRTDPFDTQTKRRFISFCWAGRAAV